MGARSAYVVWAGYKPHIGVWMQPRLDIGHIFGKSVIVALADKVHQAKKVVWTKYGHRGLPLLSILKFSSMLKKRSSRFFEVAGFAALAPEGREAKPAKNKTLTV